MPKNAADPAPLVAHFAASALASDVHRLTHRRQPDDSKNQAACITWPTTRIPA
jgi:hypothetical protein